MGQEWGDQGSRAGAGEPGPQRLYFSRVPVADAVHVQGLLGWAPALRQRSHLLAPQLQVPNSLLSHGQLLLLCLRGPSEKAEPVMKKHQMDPHLEVAYFRIGGGEV